MAQAKDGLKECTGCHEVKPVADFCRSKKTKDGRACQCRACRSEYGQRPEVKARKRALWEKHRGEPEQRRRCAERTRKYVLKREYGLTEDDYNSLWEAQHGRCLICGTGLRLVRAHIDHDHVTGRVRGILCHCCNLGLGHFRDNPDLLEKAAAYLRRAD